MSPQSLARTRDKRSLRVPRKFEDFSLVTSAETAPEVLSTSLTSTPTASTSTSVTTSPTASTTSNATSTSTTTSTTSPSTTTSATVSAPSPTPASAPSTPLPTIAPSSMPTTTTSTPITTTTIITPTTTSSLPTTATKTTTIAPPSVQSISTTGNPTNTKTTTTTAPATMLAPSPVVTSTPSSNSKSSAPSSMKSSARKKSKGLSLMAKSPTTIGPFQNNDSLNRAPIAPPQPTKYYNGLTQNMQYGTRLMLNEPIYLPQSVATIAPITTTLQQIAGLARKPPFLSKKAEACYAYQEQRKFSNILSNYMAIIRITKYLELEDVLNLRSLNRSWRAALSCEAAWQRVLIKSTNIINWKLFSQNILCRYHTSELILDQFQPSTPTKPILEALAKSSIKRLWIKTADEHQNRFAMELICGLNVLESHIKIKCRLKVVVDDNGLALVPVGIQKDSNVLRATTNELKPVPLYYCYQVCPELLNCNNDTILVELSDLEELFNRCLNQTSNRRIAINPRVDLKPI